MSDRKAAIAAGARDLDGVTVELHSRDVTLSGSTRDALLAALREHPRGDNELGHAIRKAVEDVGASRIVLLTLECKMYLLRLLEEWSLEVADDETARPELFELRNALSADLRASQPVEDPLPTIPRSRDVFRS
jgi:hypothetical protein